MSDTRFTKAEQQALLLSMQHFGNCNCTVPGNWPKRVCEGHSFLMEQDRKVSRPMRLVWIRRTKQGWIDSEWMNMPPPEQGEPVAQPVLPPGISKPVVPVLPLDTPPGDDTPTSLPW